MAQKNIDLSKTNVHLPGILGIVEQYAEGKRVELDSCQIADQKVAISASMNDAKAKAIILEDVIKFFKAAEAKKSTPTTNKSSAKSGPKTKASASKKSGAKS